MNHSDLSRRLDEVKTALDRHDRLALFLDYDGTLVPIVDDPEAADLEPESRRLLAALAARPEIELGIVSGRALEDLRDRVDLDGIRYAGNHGFEMWTEEGAWRHSAVTDCRDDLASIVIELERHLSDVPGVRIEDKYATVSVHYRTVPTERRPEVKRAVSTHADPVGSVEVATGKQVMQLRPAVAWDKGDAIRRLVGSIHGDALVLALGDDETDANGFTALDTIDRTGIAMAVDNPALPADYHLDDHEDVLALLAWLLEET